MRLDDSEEGRPAPLMLRARLHLFERGGERLVHEVGPGLHFAVVFILKTLERILVFGSVPQECNGARHAGGLSIGESAGRLLGSVVQTIRRREWNLTGPSSSHEQKIPEMSLEHMERAMQAPGFIARRFGEPYLKVLYGLLRGHDSDQTLLRGGKSLEVGKFFRRG